MLSLPTIVFTAALLHVGPEVMFDCQMLRCSVTQIIHMQCVTGMGTCG